MSRLYRPLLLSILAALGLVVLARRTVVGSMFVALVALVALRNLLAAC